MGGNLGKLRRKGVGANFPFEKNLFKRKISGKKRGGGSTVVPKRAESKKRGGGSKPGRLGGK